MAANRTAWLLRIGLVFVFLYAGIGSLLHPSGWVGYLPSFIATSSAALTIIKVIAVYELVLAAWLLSARYSRYAALLAAATLLGILAVNLNQLFITFRDVGLLFAALALASHEK